MAFHNETPRVTKYRELCASIEAPRNPLVSIIIPVFNRPKELASALRSVSAQTFSDWEVIVVDDASTDASSEIAFQVGPRGKVRVIRHEKNEGPSEARNSGISAARGRYVSFLDSDDSWHPEKLRKQVEMVEADSDPDMVFCATQTVVYRDGRRVRVSPMRPPLVGEPWSEFLYVNGGSAQTNSFFVSRELASKIGFRPPHEDHLFFLTAGAMGARYRLVAEPLSNWNDDTRADRLSLDESLERSRIFLNDARAMMTERARLAFEVRHLGPLLLKDNPLQTIKLFKRAVIEGAVLRRHLLGVCTRCLFPPPAVAVLRRIFPESAN
jgi:glycosyltransferase involved in cell wall biosynthesis